MKEKPIVNFEVRLQNFPGKVGWADAPLPSVMPDKSNPFGWIRAKGSIDNYHFEQYYLMPTGNVNLFQPVKAEVRKKIGKREGDMV